MKLRNKKTGEIGLVHCDATMFSNKIGVFIDNNHIDLRNPYKIYNSLAELNKEWEDYEEPKGVNEIDVALDAIREYCNEHLCCSEDWEKIKILNTVEKKLEAWKRLKEKGFRLFRNGGQAIFQYSPDYENLKCTMTAQESKEVGKDFDFLFGGEKCFC